MKDTPQKRWVIYKHTNLINDKVYIGQTCASPVIKRWGKEGQGYERQPVFWKDIQRYGWNNFKHEIIEDNIFDIKTANLREQYWIKYYNSMNPQRGYNQNAGGKESGFLSEETKERISLSLTQYYQTQEGKNTAKEHSLQMLGNKNPMYGQHRTQAEKDSLSKNRTGQLNVNYHKYGVKNHLSKPVYCIELNKYFGSALEVTRIMKIDNSSIGRCCNGKAITAGVFHWRYATLEEINFLKEEEEVN